MMIASRAAAGDTCTEPDPNGAECDDGVFCNGPDTCAGGSCIVHLGDPCPGADGDEDCAESCDETASDCTGHDDDDTACLDGRCKGGECLGDNGIPCADAAECWSGHCLDDVCCAQSDCTPYRCSSEGVCLAACESSADCQPTYRCLADGNCVAVATPDEGGGCGCRQAGTRSGSAWWAVVGLLGVGVGLRRRRQ